MSEKQKVHVEEVDAISWECPKCGAYNIQDKYNDLVCNECGEEFEADN